MTEHGPATSAHEQQVSPLGDLGTLADTVVIKRGNLFALSLRDGRIPARAPHPLGLYYRDCRFLSAHEIRLGGARPRLLVASDARGTEAVHELTNSDLTLDQGSLLHAESLRIRLDRHFNGPQDMRELLTVRSYHRDVLRLPLEIALAADFRSMMAIRGLVDTVEQAPQAEAEGDRLVFRARGRDGVLRSTAVTVTPAPDVREDGVLCFELDIAPRTAATVELAYAVHEGEHPRPPRSRSPIARSTRADGSSWLAEHARVRSDEELFDRILRRSLLDLWLLRSEEGDQRYYAAGIPWYATLFGRDSLITAIETLSFAPEIAEETLRLLARRLGRELDDDRDEEPGKVVHELRIGEASALGTPFANYYGTVDATPLFICLLCDHANWTGDLSLLRELRGEIDAALTWMDRFGDLDGDGLLEYRRRSPAGLLHQGWKDSHDGVTDEHGDSLEPPVALVEVQGYAVRARREIARLLELTGEDARARALARSAADLEDGLERFWLPDGGYYGMGLDADKRLSAALASNQGHLLWSGAVSPERAGRIRDALMGEGMFSGWGIRTLSEGERSYNPVGYHTGSVWPHDNALIACGLRRYGFDADFERVFDGLLEASSHFANYRLPELFAGFSRAEYENPVPYPVACRPQAWAAGAIPYLLKWGLGLSADGFNRRLRVLRPCLPRGVNHLELTGIRLAGANIDLCFERAGDRVTLADARIQGDAEVVLEIAGHQRTVLAE